MTDLADNSKLSTRADGRLASQLRPVRFQNHIAPYATGSTLIEWGQTRVICGVTIEDTVPRWMKEQNVTGGWITADIQCFLTRRCNESSVMPKEKSTDGRNSALDRAGHAGGG